MITLIGGDKDQLSLPGDFEADAQVPDKTSSAPKWQAKTAAQVDFRGRLAVKDQSIVYTMQPGDTPNAVSTALFERSLREGGITPERYKKHNPEGYQAELESFWNETLENSGLPTDYLALQNLKLKPGTELVLGTYEEHGQSLAAFLPPESNPATMLASVVQADPAASQDAVRRSGARFGTPVDGQAPSQAAPEASVIADADLETSTIVYLQTPADIIFEDDVDFVSAAEMVALDEAPVSEEPVTVAMIDTTGGSDRPRASRTDVSTTVPKRDADSTDFFGWMNNDAMADLLASSEPSAAVRLALESSSGTVKPRDDGGELRPSKSDE